MLLRGDVAIFHVIHGRSIGQMVELGKLIKRRSLWCRLHIDASVDHIFSMGRERDMSARPFRRKKQLSAVAILKFGGIDWLVEHKGWMSAFDCELNRSTQHLDTGPTEGPLR